MRSAEGNRYSASYLGGHVAQARGCLSRSLACLCIVHLQRQKEINKYINRTATHTGQDGGPQHPSGGARF